MREVTQEGHHHHHQTRTRASIYLALGIILILPILWQVYGSSEVRKWHPFYNVEYSLYWYLALISYTLKPFMYLIVARLTKKRHYTLIYCFMIYEMILFLDHILIYSQSPTYKSMSIVLSTYMVWYHYKYESTR